MSQRLSWFVSAVVMLAVSAPLEALNYEVGGCKTGSGYVNFTTISAAVAGVPAGSKIQVCPGVYPEQVTITQPLTLQGIASNNSNRAVIAINPTGGLATNVTSIIGQGLYAQVLVQNVNPPGPVNITGITVDGGGGNVGCSTSVGVGIGSFAFAGPITVSGNTVADVVGGIGVEVTSGTTATSNKMSNMNNAFFFPDGGATVKSNTVMNTTYAFDLDCFVGSTISANIVNDSQFAFQYSRSQITGNSLHNVDTIQTGSCP